MRFLWCLLILIHISIASHGKSDSKESFRPDRQWLQRELKKMNLRKSFIKEALESYQEETWERTLKLNLLGFLQPPQHMHRVDAQSVRETSRFLDAHRKSFQKAEKKYKVPSSVVSALLWIETRHGDDRGSFHIVSVYLHLLQSNRPLIRQHMTKLAAELNSKSKAYSEPEIRKIMVDRSAKKRQWAREQIYALHSIFKKKQLDLKTLKGSFAGAFGISQFIPSSYRDYAKSAQPSKAPDLYDSADAIMSVSNYLSRHGWHQKGSSAKVSALMKYNNSRDYAESILEISKKATPSVSP